MDYSKLILRLHITPKRLAIYVLQDDHEQCERLLNHYYFSPNVSDYEIEPLARLTSTLNLIRIAHASLTTN